MIIDSHAHIVPEAFVESVRAGRFGAALSIEQGPQWELLVIKSSAEGDAREFKNALPKETFDVGMRLKHMAAMGVDRQILSIVPPAMGYGLDAALNGEVAAAFNDRVADVVAENPDRFSCVATVPLQNPEAAVLELERAGKKGHIGVQIGSNVAGKNLDDPALDIFWKKVVSLDLPIFIHPINQLGEADRLKSYQLGNLIGVPLEGGIAAASLIFGGVLDRYPDLRIVLSHMGGITPWVRGRWEHGYFERAGTNVNGVQVPGVYLGRFYYDTIVHDAECFQFAARTLGTEMILYGTDYPFDMGNLGPARDIPGLSSLPEADREKILAENAKKVFGI
ncbi:amidohydrolase family protein [Nitrospinota bacterium]